MGAFKKYPDSETAALENFCRGSGASYTLKFDTTPSFEGFGEVEEVTPSLLRVGGASMSFGWARAECLSYIVK